MALADAIASHDSEEHKRVELLGHRLADVVALSNDRTNVNWEFSVIKDEQKNAFVLPGGKVFVNTGMLEFSDNELAAVLSHEIGHVQARHAAERLSMSRFPTLIKWVGQTTASINGGSLARFMSCRA